VLSQGALVTAGLGLALRLLVAPSYGLAGVDGDLIELKQSVHVALEQGFHEIYRAGAGNDPALTGREWEGGYFTNQPPVIHYLRVATGGAYRLLSPEGFALWPPDLNFLETPGPDLQRRLAASRGFTVALKLPGILADALITLGLFAFAASRAGEGTAWLVAGAYALNPGIVFDTAYWGQHDAVAAGALALGLLLVHRGRVEAAAACATLAALTKPQAGAVLPLLLALAWQRFPPGRVARAGLAATATAALVFAPFVLGGTLGISVDALLRSTFGGEPFVSCNAANLWWLLTGGHGYEVGDAVPFLGPLTPRTLGLISFLGACMLLATRLRGRPDPDGTLAFLAAAVLAMSFFSVGTELHENHMMAVLPLLAFALPGVGRGLGAVFALLSATFLLNMALFDPSVVEPAARILGVSPFAPALSLGVAAANAAGLLALWRIYWQRTGIPSRAEL
jgi:hypothetical protein